MNSHEIARKLLEQPSIRVQEYVCGASGEILGMNMRPKPYTTATLPQLAEYLRAIADAVEGK